MTREERKANICYDADIFGARLKKILEEQHLSKNSIQIDTGISSCTLSNYTNGLKMPSGKTLQVLCSYLGVSADYLLGLSNDAELPKKWIFKEGECRCPYCDGKADPWYPYCPNCGKRVKKIGEEDI